MAAASWVWFLEQEAVDSILTLEPDNTLLAKRAAAHPTIVNAIRFHIAGQPEKALSALLAVAPAARDADVSLLTGQLAYELGRWDEAAEAYRQLAAAQPGHPYAAFNCGLALVRARRWKPATEALQNAVLVAAGHAQPWYLLGVCLLQENRLAEASASFHQAAELRPDYAPACFGEAVALQLLQRHRDALPLYQRLLATRPDQPEILENALTCALTLGQEQQAAEWAERLTRIHPQSAAATQAAFLADLAANHLTTAEENLRQRDAAAADWYNLGVAFLRGTRTADAARAFLHARQLDPADALILEGVARTTSTREAWEALLARDPNHAEAWFHVGLACLEAASSDAAQLAAVQLAAATSAFTRASALRPNWPEAWANLGAALHMTQKSPAAIEAYQQALTLNPTLHPARQALFALALDRGDAPAAQAAYDPQHLSSPAAAAQLGFLWQQRGDTTHAIACYQDAIRLDPDCPTARWNLGHLEFTQGNFDAAREHWAAALARDPRILLTGSTIPPTPSPAPVPPPTAGRSPAPHPADAPSPDLLSTPA